MSLQSLILIDDDFYQCVLQSVLALWEASSNDRAMQASESTVVEDGNAEETTRVVI